GLASLKRPESIANGVFRFHVLPSKRVLESGHVTPCTRFIKLDVKIHNRVHSREGRHEQTHITLRGLPKMVKHAFDRRVCGRCEERPVEFAVTFPEFRGGWIVRRRLKVDQRTTYRLNVVLGHSRN